MSSEAIARKREQRKLAQRRYRARRLITEYGGSWVAFNKSAKEKKAGRPCPDLCEICDRPPVHKRKTLCYDHCHETGRFRGWICSACNIAIGMARDKPEVLRRMAAYLEGQPD